MCSSCATLNNQCTTTRKNANDDEESKPKARLRLQLNDARGGPRGLGERQGERPHEVPCDDRVGREELRGRRLCILGAMGADEVAQSVPEGIEVGGGGEGRVRDVVGAGAREEEGAHARERCVRGGGKAAGSLGEGGSGPGPMGPRGRTHGPAELRRACIFSRTLDDSCVVVLDAEDHFMPRRNQVLSQRHERVHVPERPVRQQHDAHAGRTALAFPRGPRAYRESVSCFSSGVARSS